MLEAALFSVLISVPTSNAGDPHLSPTQSEVPLTLSLIRAASAEFGFGSFNFFAILIPLQITEYIFTIN